MNTGYSLDSDETVIRVTQGHWIGLLPVVVSPLALIGVGIGVIYAYGRFPDMLGFIPASAVSLLSLIFFLLAAAILMIGSFVFRQNKMLLTDKHLIIVAQNGLFSRTVAQLSLLRVQDVKAIRVGVLATILNYGTIEIETAGEVENFRFYLAPKPQELADLCLAVHDRRPDVLPENSPEPTDHPIV